MEDSNPELESFRQQWRAEVSARSRAEASKRQQKPSIPSSVRSPAKKEITAPRASADRSKPAKEEEVEEEHEEDIESHKAGYTPAVQEHKLQSSEESSNSHDVDVFSKSTIQEPRSALEHYEKAVEKEAQGSLGDSLHHYRKAFRMDNRVDLKYKNKHFPPSSFVQPKPNDPNPSNASPTVPNTAHHSLEGPQPTITDLIASFNGLAIEPAAPEIEGTPAPPCPISTLPDEILIHILTDLAIIDVASFARLAQVCKRLAYLVATEEAIWKRICVGEEVGFGGMHYDWQVEVEGYPILPLTLEEADSLPLFSSSSAAQKELTTTNLLTTTYHSSWQRMFRLRPRIRFNGVYISTVNYIRPGQASPSQTTWHNPIHIVTYYRYLRFYRDGTVLSLLSTTEPTDVVHHLSKESYNLHRNNANPHLPSAVVSQALRGRWHLSSANDLSETSDVSAMSRPNPTLKVDKDASVASNGEGDLFIETEGVGAKYIYRLELAIRHSGRGMRNNKLQWKGFWNYNKLTDDWGEFGLRNDKAFFFSRVVSYGVGGY